MAARQVVVPLKPGSDGDYTHRPSDHSKYTVMDPPTLYLEKVAMQWMQDRGEARPGIKYILERLPTGYALYQRPRSNGTKDKYLFGHPNQKIFDSPNRFYPHFKHMMENNGDMFGCRCLVCDPRGGHLPGKPASASSYFSASKKAAGSSSGSSWTTKVNGTNYNKGSNTGVKAPMATLPLLPFDRINGNSDAVGPKPLGRPKLVSAGMDASHVDEEGTPDVYRNLIDRLKRHGTLDEIIKEPLSLDWLAEQEIMPPFLDKLKRDPQWIPRVGDILLYVRDVSQGLRIAKDAEGTYQVCDPQKSDQPLGTAVWEMGIVTQAPASKDGQWCVSQSGVRVEPLPNPNDSNKSFSKQYTYVPLEHTRPFFLWEECLANVTWENRHPTIANAFTGAATMSLMGRYRFQGQWPEANIFCRAIYIGAEIITVGDTVRLVPKGRDYGSTSTDVLVVKSIRLKLSSLDSASSNDYDEGRPYNLGVWVYGAAFTTVASRSSKEWLDETNSVVPRAGAGYGDWYPLHPSHRELAVPFSRIIGRLYEYDAMRTYVSVPDLDTGREGITHARFYSSHRHRRIVANEGTNWYWGDNRADALDLQTVNSVNVAKHDFERDPKEWRKKIKDMDSGAKVLNRKSGPSLRGFMAPASTSLPVRASVSRTEEVTRNSSTSAGERPIIEVSDDEEEEILRQTKVVTKAPYKEHSLPEEVTRSSSTNSGKRRIEVSDDEEEILRQTKVVTDVPYKKQKVLVVIN